VSANKKFNPLIVETPQSHAAIRGRGASWIPANRFEKLHIDLTDADVVEGARETEETPRRGNGCDQSVIAAAASRKGLPISVRAMLLHRSGDSEMAGQGFGTGWRAKACFS